MTDSVSKLAAFTGYYTMTGAGGVSPGAFLSIDTTEQHFPKATAILINHSMDGKTASEPYLFGDGATFDGKTLNIPGKLTLQFTREYKDGRLVTFSGTIGDVDVSGYTYFNPTPLSAFVGDYYYDATKTKKALSITATEILFDFSALSGTPSGQLTAVSRYSYVPAMFVLTFDGPPDSQPSKFMLMLGTAAVYGLACSIQDGNTPPQFKPKMVLSIP